MLADDRGIAEALKKFLLETENYHGLREKDQLEIISEETNRACIFAIGRLYILLGRIIVLRPELIIHPSAEETLAALTGYLKESGYTVTAQTVICLRSLSESAGKLRQPFFQQHAREAFLFSLVRMAVRKVLADANTKMDVNADSNVDSNSDSK